MRTSPRRGPPLALIAPLLCASLAALAGAAGAQVAEGPGPTALGVPGGTVRVSLGVELAQWNEVFDPTGERELAVANFNAPFGPAQLTPLRRIERDLRTASGQGDFSLTLGTLGVSADARVTRVPLLLEAGITNWLSLSFLLPVVRTRHEVYLRPNPAGNEGNVSVNPYLAATHSNANDDLQAQLGAARTALAAQLGGCASDPALCTPGQLDARRLYLLSDSLATALAETYGGGTAGDPAAYVPIAGSAVHAAIVNRIDSVATAFETYIGGTAPITARPQGAFGQLTLPEAQALLEHPFFNFVRPGAVERRGIGDIEVGTKVVLLDSFRGEGESRFDPSGVNLRLAVGGAFRAGTGFAEPSAPFDIPTGDGQHDIEARAWADVLLGSRLWATVAARYTWQLADRELVRITDTPEMVFPGQFRERLVDRDLGDYYEIEVAPRLALGRSVTLSAHYAMRRKAADTFTGRFVVSSEDAGETEADEEPGPSVVLDAATLGAETEARFQRVGIGFSYSNEAAYARRRARFPVEVSYLHLETIAGEGGRVPRARIDQIQLRFYTRLFGGGPLVR